MGFFDENLILWQNYAEKTDFLPRRGLFPQKNFYPIEKRAFLSAPNGGIFLTENFILRLHTAVRIKPLPFRDPFLVLTLFYLEQGLLRQTTVTDAPIETLPKHVVWIDLHYPTQEEERVAEHLLGVEMPTRDEMQEIEASSRLYVEEGAVVMIMPVLNKTTTDEPESKAITFMLAHDRLVTLRYTDPVPFTMFINRLTRFPAMATSGEQVTMGLLEQIADCLADILESGATNLDALSHGVFRHRGDTNVAMDFKDILRRIGYVADIATKAKDSLLNLNRLALFLMAHVDLKKEGKARVKTLMQDANSIDEHARFLSAKASFLLDATLGMINIEQNNIIKIFSVAAVAFLPPTLIASIYGMNFRFMPELEWAHGYPLALVLMLISAILPFWYFKRKKWL